MTPDLQLPKKVGKWEISFERAQDEKSGNEDSTDSTKYYFNTKYTAKVIQNALSQIGSVKIIHAQVHRFENGEIFT